DAHCRTDEYSDEAVEQVRQRHRGRQAERYIGEKIFHAQRIQVPKSRSGRPRPQAKIARQPSVTRTVESTAPRQVISRLANAPMITISAVAGTSPSPVMVNAKTMGPPSVRSAPRQGI